MPRRLIALCVLTLLCLLQAAVAQGQSGGKPTPPPATPAPLRTPPKGTVPADQGPGLPAPPAPSPPAAPATPATTPPTGSPAVPPTTSAGAPAAPVAAASPREGKARWLKTMPAPGTKVRLRLRGPALGAVLDPGQRWQLVSVDANGNTTAATAQLEMPAAAPAPKVQQLTILKRSDVTAKDAWVIVDRGASPPPLDRLRVTLADVKYRQPVRIEAGNSLDKFTSAGADQLLIQDLRGGDLVTLDTVLCKVDQLRFVRITLPGGGALKIDSVSGWLEPARPALYTIPVALGPMHSDSASGNSLWPLLLSDYGVPVARLKVSATAQGDGQTRNMRVVRLSKDGAVLSSSAGLPWAQQVASGGAVRDERWLNLSPPELKPEPLGISVADGKDQPLQLHNAALYAAEVCLTCTLPADGELRLRVHPAAEGEVQPTGEAAPETVPAEPVPAGQRQVAAPDGTLSPALGTVAATVPTASSSPAPATVTSGTGGAPGASVTMSAVTPERVIDGEFSALTPFAAPPVRPAATKHAKSRYALPFAVPGWASIVLFAVPGLLLLWLGIGLLRRPRVV